MKDKVKYPYYSVPQVAREELEARFFEWWEEQDDSFVPYDLPQKNEDEDLLILKEDPLANFTSSPRTEAFENKLEELQKGLTFYLNNADDVQENLIEHNAEAANLTMLVEGILVTCDQNKELKSFEEANILVAKTMGSLLNDPLPKEMVAGIAQEIWPFIEKTQNEPTRENSRALREEIESRILHFPTGVEKISDERISLFRESRQARTDAVNDYYTSLTNSLNKLSLGALENSNNKTKILDKQKLQSAINIRIKQLESLRKGVIKKLPKQDPLLTEIGIQDLTDNFRNMQSSSHPRIARIKEMGQTLHQMVNIAPNPCYRKDIPGVRIRESGIKSWKRTIAKLFNQKNADWSKMTDLSRINPVFSSAESMYFYNTAIHQLAPRLGWKHTKIDKNTLGDKGPRMVESGTINWGMCLERADKKLFAETKLDSLSISRTEPVGHVLYELAREVFKGDREASDPDLDELQFRQTLSQKITSNMDMLLVNKNLMGEELQKELKTIKTFGHELATNSSLKTTIYEKIVDTEAMIRFQSIRDNASPSMAAMFTNQFNQLIEKLDTKIEKSDETLRATRERQKERLLNLFEKYGPKLGKTEGKGNFTQYDLDLDVKMYANFKMHREETINTNKTAKSR